MVHVGDAVMQGFHEILVWTVDTDVVVLAVAVVQQLTRTEQTELCIAFGCGKDFRYIPVHKMCDSLGPQRSLALPVFHDYTGCGTVSHFVQVGKKTADAWWIHCNNLLWAAQCTLAKSNGWRDRASLEYFPILLYDTRVTGSSINEVRKNLFIHKGCQMSGLPPTKAAPWQHMNRAVLQGGHYWDCTTLAYWQLPSPVEWGWTCAEQWKSC